MNCACVNFNCPSQPQNEAARQTLGSLSAAGQTCSFIISPRLTSQGVLVTLKRDFPAFLAIFVASSPLEGKAKNLPT